MHIQDSAAAGNGPDDGQKPHEAPAQPLALICPEAFDGGALCAILTQDHRIGPHVTLEAAAQTLESDPDRRILLLVEDCAAFVARRIAQGLAPAAAAAAWQSAIRPVMLLMRHNRRRILLHRIGMVHRHAEVFAQHLALDRDTARKVQELHRAAPDPIRALLGETVVQQAPELRRLSNEIEASAADLSNGAPRSLPDADQAGAWLARIESGTTAQDAAEAAQNERIAELTAQIKTLTLEVQDRDRRVNDAEAEQALMMQILHQVQKELETRHGELRELAGKLAEERRKATEFYDKAIEYMAENKAVQAEKDRVTDLLDATMASRSYRVMAPLRRLRAALARRG